MHQKLVYECLMGDSVKSLSKNQVDNIDCSLYQANHFITEIHQDGKA